jgi:hypothetical protein
LLVLIKVGRSTEPQSYGWNIQHDWQSEKRKSLQPLSSSPTDQWPGSGSDAHNTKREKFRQQSHSEQSGGRNIATENDHSRTAMRHSFTNYGNATARETQSPLKIRQIPTNNGTFDQERLLTSEAV